MGVIFGIGLYYNYQSNSRLNDVYKYSLLPIKWVNDMNARVRANEALLEQIVLDPSKQKDIVDQINSNVDIVNKDLASYKGNDLETYESDRILKLEEAIKTYRTESNNLIKMAQSENQQQAYAYYVKNVGPAVVNITNIIEELADFDAKQADDQNAQAQQSFEKAIANNLTVAIIAIILGLLIGIWVSRIIAKPLKEIAEKASEIADGNLAIEYTELKSTDEVGQLSSSVGLMLRNLIALIKQISSITEQVSSSSEELYAIVEQNTQATTQITSAITEVSAGTEKQSSAIDETSAAIEQMSASIQQMAATTNMVAQQTEVTANITNEGKLSVENAVKQMGAVASSTALVGKAVSKLSNSSQQIGGITDVISGIAEQTNLLALNAAIEAARAGDQGRGFAVVAEEVRKLAEQSAEAATKIASLINDNKSDIYEAVRSMESGAKDVELGIEVVNKAGESFNSIASSVDEVATQVQEISATTQQMASSSQQVVVSVREIETISKDNLSQTQTVSAASEEQLASVEQIASASQSLATMVQELQTEVSKFRL